MKRRLTTTLIASAIVLLGAAGCGTEEPAEQPAATPAAAETTTVAAAETSDEPTEEPTPAPTETTTEAPAETTEEPTPEEDTAEADADAEDYPADVTDNLLAVGEGEDWAAFVEDAEQTEEERLVVTTTVTDPRGDDGSDAAELAIATCEAAVEVLEDQGSTDPKVSILESDGTSYVLYGHPAYPGGCVEV